MISLMQSDAAQQTAAILANCQAILHDDHFVYISGQHGSGWVDKDAIFVDLSRVRQLGELLAAAVRDLAPDFLCGPATGGLIVAQWTAAALGLPAVFADHSPSTAAGDLRGRFVLRRGYDRLVAGRRVLVVDDVVKSGHSIRETIGAVRAAGGQVVGAAALVHRGNVDRAGLDAPEFRYLLELAIPEWPPESCPLCKAGVPVNTRYAHGQGFLSARRYA